MLNFAVFLDESNALRVRFVLEHGRVVKFIVQLECRFDNSPDWVPVIRYDTAHGFAHCDRLHPYKPVVKTKLETKDYNEALTVTLDDLADNWSKYRRRYEKWLRKK
ncbi:MAG TPA: hypothetical protein EYP90_07000 [Chromatiaceae bacterium]|nr:hypothetical protein [Chromatiaceae bacterium]